MNRINLLELLISKSIIRESLTSFNLSKTEYISDVPILIPFLLSVASDLPCIKIPLFLSMKIQSPCVHTPSFLLKYES